MAEVRDLLAIALEILLGLVLLAAPQAAAQFSVDGVPQNRRSKYGADGEVPGRYL